MPPEDVVDLIDEMQREIEVALLARRPMESQEVARRERVGPEIAPRRCAVRQAGRLGEREHELARARLRAHEATDFARQRLITASRLNSPPPCAAMKRKMKQRRTAGTPWFWTGHV